MREIVLIVLPYLDCSAHPPQRSWAADPLGTASHTPWHPHRSTSLVRYRETLGWIHPAEIGAVLFLALCLSGWQWRQLQEPLA